MATLKVQPATEADLPRIIEIQFAAFANDPYQWALFPGDPDSPEVRKQAEQLMLDWWRKNPVSRFMKCIDTTDGTIVGFADWFVREHERPETEWRDRPIAYWVPEGPAREKCEKFLHANSRLREDVWGGKPHLLLNLLAVHPDHHRKGVGSLLVTEGIAHAASKSLPAWLEASPSGYFLYRKLGFREVDREVIKAEQWGGDHDCILVGMMKDAENASASSANGHIVAATA